MDDAYLATHLQEALANDSRVHEPELRVVIRGGRIHVTGSVPTAQRRDAVSEVIRELAPDVGIDNFVEVSTFEPNQGSELVQ